MSRSSFLLFGIFLVFFFLSKNAVKAASLLDFVENAVEKNQNLQSSRAQIESSKLESKISRSGLLPSLSFSTSQSYNNNTSFVRAGEDNNDTFEQRNYSLSFSQVLFDPETYINFQGSKISLTLQKLQYQRDYQELLNTVLGSYLGYLRALTQLRTTRLELESANERLRKIKRSFELGNVARTDVLESQSFLESILAREEIQKNSLAVSLRQLHQSSVLYETPTMDIRLSSELKDIEQEESKKWHDIALEKNPSILIAKKDLEDVRNDLRAGYARFSPTVSLNANHAGSYNTASGANNETLNGKTQDQSLTINLNLPFYTGGSRIYNLDKVRNELSIAQSDLRFAINTNQADLDSVILNINSNIRSLEILQNSVQISQNSYEALQKAYKLGERSLNDVLDAQTTLYNTIRDYYSTRYEYLTNLSDFHRLNGTLSLDIIARISNEMEVFNKQEPLKIPVFEEQAKEPVKTVLNIPPPKRKPRIQVVKDEG